MIKKALRDLIVAASAIADELATYEFTTGATKTPAVFTARNIPKDATLPCVFIKLATTSQFGTRDSKGGEILADVQLIGNKGQSDKALEDLATAIWLLLDRATLTVSGYVSHGCIADPPIQTTVTEGYPSHTIQVRAFITQ